MAKKYNRAANLGTYLHPAKKKRAMKLAEDFQKPDRMKGKPGGKVAAAPMLSLYPK